MCEEECNSVEEHIQSYVEYGLGQLPWKDMDELKIESAKEHEAICEKLNKQKHVHGMIEWPVWDDGIFCDACQPIVRNENED